MMFLIASGTSPSAGIADVVPSVTVVTWGWGSRAARRRAGPLWPSFVMSLEQFAGLYDLPHPPVDPVEEVMPRAPPWRWIPVEMHGRGIAVTLHQNAVAVARLYNVDMVFDDHGGGGHGGGGVWIASQRKNGVGVKRDWVGEADRVWAHMWLSRLRGKKMLQLTSGSPASPEALFFASKDGDVEGVRTLLDLMPGIDLAEKFEFVDEFMGATPLYVASAMGHAHVVRELLRDRAHVYSPERALRVVAHTDLTPLAVAAFFGHIEVVKILLGEPLTDINQVGERAQQSSKDPYFSSIYPKPPEALCLTPSQELTYMRMMKQMKKPVSKLGLTPLVCAIVGGHTDIVQILLKEPKLDINKTCGMANLTALHYATLFGCIAQVKLLLRAPKINASKPDSTGCTPLHTAAGLGYLAVVNVLLDKAPYAVDAADYSIGKFTPFHAALIGGHQHVVHALVDALSAPACVRQMLAAIVSGSVAAVRAQILAWGKFINHRSLLSNSDYWVTPLVYAASIGNVAVVRELLGFPGIDVNRTSSAGDTPLHAAILGGHTEVAMELLAFPNVDVFKACDDGSTPLMFASSRGLLEVVLALLEVPGLDINEATEIGDTALTYACRFGHFAIVEVLLGVPSIDVNRASLLDGATPLYFACFRGHSDMVSMLLNVPCIDTNKANIYGETPIAVASRLCFIDVVNLLLHAQSGIDANRGDRFGLTPIMKTMMRTQELDLCSPMFSTHRFRYEATRSPINLQRTMGFDFLIAGAGEMNIRLEILRYLLSAPGIDLNLTCQFSTAQPAMDGRDPSIAGWTVLAFACEIGSMEAVLLLLESPRIQLIRDGRGLLAAECARRKSHHAVADVVEEAVLVKHILGQTMLVLARAGVPSQCLAALAFRGLGDKRLQADAKRKLASWNNLCIIP